MRIRITRLIGTRAVALAAAVLVVATASADIVTEWNAAVRDAIRATSTPPPRASRAMAMVHAAVYDAVNAVDRTHVPYRWQSPAAAGTSREAAAASAAHRVLSSLYPSLAPTFDARLAQQLGAIGSGPSVDAGLALGVQVAEDMAAWRVGDGSAAGSSYQWQNAPGRWRPTAPGMQPLLPQWGAVTPFGVPAAVAFRPQAPPALSTAAYAAAVNDVKEIGRVDSATRTADQTQIARFWSNGAGTETPPGHWNRIAGVVADSAGLSLSERARMYAQLNVALADAAIVSWECKYHYDLWRPITAIRDAEFDDNPDTLDDDTWQPLLTTPAFPEYTSGHSTFSGAGAAALAAFFGSDAISFSVGSDDLPGVTRSYAGFSDAALESGLSRIYGGIHYSFANVAGIESGAAVGAYVASNYFGIIPEPGTAVLSLGALLATAMCRRR